MAVALRIPEQAWTAERFLATDQHAFGDAWRYELVDGRIVAHAAQSPEHGAILAGLTTALSSLCAAIRTAVVPRAAAARCRKRHSGRRRAFQTR